MLNLRSGCDGRCFSAGILHRVVREKSCHGMRVSTHFLDGGREPLVDGAVHQSVGKPVHDHHGQRRKQERAGDHAGAKLRAQDSQSAFSKKLQQVAHQHERERNEEQENQRRESSEDDDVLVVSGTQESEVKGGLGDKDRKQNKDKIASRIMTCLRCEVFWGGIGVDCATEQSASRLMLVSD